MTRARALAAFAIVVVVVGCLPELRSPAGAQLRCAGDQDCPADLVCLAAYGECEPRDGPCVEAVGDTTRPARNGGACDVDTGAGVCIDGKCVASVCGDAIVDKRRGEQCDEGEDNADADDTACLADCRLPFCGDGFVEHLAGETCEGEVPHATCTVCRLTCDESFGDCNADPHDGCECQSSVLIGVFGAELELPPEVDGIYFVGEPHLAASGGDLWFADAGFLFRVTGGTVAWLVDPTTLDDFISTADIALDDEHVFYSANNTVIRANRVGQPDPAIIATTGDNDFAGVGTVAPGPALVYFVDQSQVLATEKGEHVDFYWIAQLAGPFADIAADADGLYFADLDGGFVARADPSGVVLSSGDPPPEHTVLAADQLDPRGVVVVDGAVYWGTADGAIRRVPAGGGDIEQLAQLDRDVANLVVVGDSVYWSAVGVADGRGKVYRLRLDIAGAQPAPVMDSDSEVRDVAVSDDNAFASIPIAILRAPLR